MSAHIDSFQDLRDNKIWDIEAMSTDDLYKSFAVLNQNMSVIYKFVLGYNDYINMRHNYSSEETLTMLEAHLLTDVCDMENATVTSLSKSWGRSVSATSQTVRKLMSKGLVVRENSEMNGKIFYLKPTEKGIRVSDAHKKYDTLDIIKTVKVLMRTLSFDEINTMFKSMASYSSLLQAN